MGIAGISTTCANWRIWKTTLADIWFFRNFVTGEPLIQTAAARRICWLKTLPKWSVLGNHEMAEMTNFPIRKRGKLLNILFALGLQYRYGTANAWQVHEWMTKWFWSCPVAVRWKNDVFFSHSIPSDCSNYPYDFTFFDRPLEEQDFSYNGEFSRLVWGRDYLEDNACAFADGIGAKFLITGHEPCLEMGFKQPNPIQIILDCCDDTPAYIHLTADMPTDPMTMRSAVHFL